MKKEVFLAITIGFGLGLIITYGVWLANKSLKSLPQTASQIEPSNTSAPTPTTTSTTPAPTTKTKPPGQITVTITSPIDELLSDKDTIKLEGTATPYSIVVLTYEGSEQIVTADTAGKFSADIALDGGYNFITAAAFDKAGNTATAMITVTYTTSKI